MTNVLKKTLVFTTILGLIMVSLYTLFGDEVVTSITKVTYAPNCAWYIIDFRRYFDNLQNTAILNMSSMLPQTPQGIPLNVVDLASGLTLVNCFIWILNWLLFIVAYAILLPIKIIAYFFILIFALIGINTNATLNFMRSIYTWNPTYVTYLSLS